MKIIVFPAQEKLFKVFFISFPLFFQLAQITGDIFPPEIFGNGNRICTQFIFPIVSVHFNSSLAQ